MHCACGAVFCRLPIELQSRLHVTRWVGLGNAAEGSVADIAKIRVRGEEVRVVECIEHFDAELQPLAFAEIPPFLDSHVPIHVAWSAKDRKISRRITER